MNKYFKIIYIIILYSTHNYSQNLVKNPSFETIDLSLLNCSWNINGNSVMLAATNWDYPTNAIPDIFHMSLPTSCYSHPLSSHSATNGQQLPRTGDCMTNIVTYGGGGCAVYREYLQGELTSPLTAGVTYDVKMFVSLFDKCDRGTNNIGFKFTNSKQSINNSCVWEIAPSVNYSGPPITDKEGWTLLNFQFTPTTSDLIYFTIGNFSDDIETTTTLSSGTLATISYFIDDISITESSTSCNLTIDAGTAQNLNCNLSQTSLNGTVTNGAAPFSYSWTPLTGLSDPNIANPIASPNATTTYTLKVTDANFCSKTSIVTVTVESKTPPIATNLQTFCTQQNATVNSIAITGQNIKWYDALTNGNLLSNTTALVSGTTYYASQTINGCESNRVAVAIQILNTPAPSGNANQSFCSNTNATLTDISTNGTNVTWYSSASNTTPLATTTLLTHNTTYYATQTINGCESTNRLAVTINLIIALNATNYSEIICDNLNDSTETIDLSSYTTNLTTSTGNIFGYYDSYANALNQNSSGQINNFASYNLPLGTNIFYVRIDSPNTCFQIVTLTLQLVSKPFIPINDISPICDGNFITLNGGNNYDSYTWSTGETSQNITITQIGSYSVIVTKNYGTITCTSTKNFTVVNSKIAIIQEIISSDWTDNNNTITVLLENNSQGDYEYSINGYDFQDNNIFNNVDAGEYTVFVRDKNGCGIVSEELYLLMYPKFFTPNGDGYNDYWKIKFSEIEPNLTVKIFDRYGKFIKQLGSNSIGWDGTYLGKDVPSSDYWFVVTRENGKEYKGHFSLKR